MSALYEDFMMCQGRWQNSVVYKTIRRLNRSGQRGVRRWLTRSQMLVVFGDPEIVDSIIVRKEADENLRATETREHPDCPGTTDTDFKPFSTAPMFLFSRPPGLMQYLVLVEEEVTDETLDTVEDLFQMEDREESEASQDDNKNDKGADKTSGTSTKESPQECCCKSPAMSSCQALQTLDQNEHQSYRTRRRNQKPRTRKRRERTRSPKKTMKARRKSKKRRTSSRRFGPKHQRLRSGLRERKRVSKRRHLDSCAVSWFLSLNNPCHHQVINALSKSIRDSNNKMTGSSKLLGT